jgi:hypothetical protein
MSQSLLVADPQLADTEAALAEWRKTLHCLSHIPEDLWSRATELAERHGLAKVTVALKLDTTRLKRWLRGTDKTSTEGGRASPPSPALVEFNFVLPLAQSPCVLVLSDRYGRTLRIELPRLASSDRFPCPRSFATAVARSPPDDLDRSLPAGELRRAWLLEASAECEPIWYRFVWVCSGLMGFLLYTLKMLQPFRERRE